MWPVYDIIEAIMTSLIIKNADMRMLVAALIGARKFTLNSSLFLRMPVN